MENFQLTWDSNLMYPQVREDPSIKALGHTETRMKSQRILLHVKFNEYKNIIDCQIYAQNSCNNIYIKQLYVKRIPRHSKYVFYQ